MTRLLAISAAVFTLCTPAFATAWDFSCSPRTSTEIELAPPPNIMLMLDRSGSMGDGDRTRACKVCEDTDGTRYEVADAADCAPRGIRWEEVRSSSYGQDNQLSGFTHTLTFDNLPPASEDLTLELDIYGDSGGTCEFYSITIDGVDFGVFNPLYNGNGCRTRSTTFTVPATFAADGQVVVVVQASPDNNDCNGANVGCANSSNCDGVDASCSTNSATATLGQNPRVYWGTQAWSDPCGTEDKWDQAVRAIDLLTLEAQSTSPEQAHFGFGYFHDNTTATILEDCRPSNHAAIMSSIAPLYPTGGTPTALGIRTAAQSACVADTGSREVASQTDTVPRNSSNYGYDHTFTFTGLPTGANGAEITVDLFGDFGSACEFAFIKIDGITVGSMTGSSDCNSPGSLRQTFPIPPSAISDGAITVVVDTRDRNDVSANPACAPGDPSVNAYCDDNGATVSVRMPSNDGKASASIIINDGAPTKSLDGREARHASIYEACQHRDTANAYVVGLGSGTDEDFNNILAAAGGTGECTVAGMAADPCDDPAAWEDLRGRCTGSFQADDGSAMLAALAEITAEIACTYPVDFTNSNRESVPPDASNAYDYLTVEVLRAGTVERVYNVNSPFNPTPGEGWTFASSERKQVRMSPGYCSLVNSGEVQVVDTQLACLCQETPGASCTVPGANILGVCPDGSWICIEGVDICEPELNCCKANEPCNTGLPGICAGGRTVCNGDVSTCVPINEPQDEICDGLDNDCDGIVDEIESSNCEVPGRVGRCAQGVRVCSGRDEVCEPLFGPMPEICNGLDDDCDGERDNITVSWKKPEFSSIDITDEVRPLTCNVTSVCVCNEGTDDHAGATFEEFIEEWDPVCQCGAGLEWDESSSAEPQDSVEPQAGCATSDGGGTGAVLFTLLGLAFMGGLRRRD